MSPKYFSLIVCWLAFCTRKLFYKFWKRTKPESEEQKKKWRLKVKLRRKMKTLSICTVSNFVYNTYSKYHPVQLTWISDLGHFFNKTEHLKHLYELIFWMYLYFSAQTMDKKWTETFIVSCLSPTPCLKNIHLIFKQNKIK